MIFSEESSRAVYRDGQHGVDRTETNPGDYSVFFLPEARTKGNEHVSMRRMGSTQSKYDAPNQSSSRSVEKSYYRTTVFLSRGRKNGHNQWQKYHQKSHGCKMRGNEKTRIHLYTGPMTERRNIPGFSIGARLGWDAGQVPRLHLQD